MTSPGYAPRMSPLRTALIGALVVALGPVSLSLYSPAMPLLVSVFGTTPVLLNMTMTLYFLGYAFSQLVCGPLSDAYGRRPVALGFFAIYLLGSVIALTAPSIAVMLAGRLLQGIGVAVGATVSRALVRDQFAGVEASRIMNLIGLVLAVGPAVSPMLGGTILTLFGWRWIFVAMVGYGVVVLLVLGLAMRETNLLASPARARPLRVLINYGSLLRHKVFLQPAVLLGATVGTLYTLAPLMPFLLIRRLGMGPGTFALAMLAQTGSYVVGSLATAWMLRRIDEGRVVRFGLGTLVLAMLAFVLLPRLLLLSPSVVLVPAGLVAFSIALLAPTTTMRALSGSLSLAGSAAALLGFLQIGCGMAGSAISAMLFDDPVTAFDTVPPSLLLIALSAAAARRRGRRA
jgi:MFS transporter, DHA1 family, multidrug resistance protein